MIDVRQFQMKAPREPFVAATMRADLPDPGMALVRVAGCGLCHTDIGFYLGDVKTNHPLPLTLGHEISGIVERAGAGAETWIGRPVVVPAVVPCGECGPCKRGRYALCGRQIFFGNDVHGGFATHVTAPARALCEVPSSLRPKLASLSVVADAVSTPYEAVKRSGLAAGDVAIFVGAGGVGGFGVQIAAALGGHVIALDISPERRDLMLQHGARLALDPSAADVSALRRTIRDHVKEQKLNPEEWKIFETSGTAKGQDLAFSLMTRGAHLGVVGYTNDKVTLQMSRLMALDARAEGNWACAPGRFPEVIQLVADGKIAIDPFVEQHPLSRINEVFTDMLAHKLHRRAVLVPEQT